MATAEREVIYPLMLWKSFRFHISKPI